LQKIAFIVSYDGTNYYGFQRQSELPTIQSELERALSEIAQEPIAVVGSGRTDAGVHAYGQVVHFQTRLKIPAEKWPLAIKNYLPEDIVVRAAYQVKSQFHARYDAVGKIYQYRIDRGLVPNVFQRRYAYHVPYPIDLNLIGQAIPYLEGTHDFTAFCASGSAVENHVRTIYRIGMREEEEQLLFTFHGNGFLYNMVRIMVGTLIAVGNGKIPAEEIPRILASKDRNLAGPTAPAHGLTLMKVEYPMSIFA
jgi:tRNA pseudouridine38-40 synthase